MAHWSEQPLGPRYPITNYYSISDDGPISHKWLLAARCLLPDRPLALHCHCTGPIEHSIERSIACPIEHSIERSIACPIEHSTERSIACPIEHSIGQASFGPQPGDVFVEPVAMAASALDRSLRGADGDDYAGHAPTHPHMSARTHTGSTSFSESSWLCL